MTASGRVWQHDHHQDDPCTEACPASDDPKYGVGHPPPTKDAGCPHCHAPPDEMCRTADGRRAVSDHTARRRANATALARRTT